MRKALSLIVYNPALNGNISRTLDVIHGMESTLAGLRLDWTLSEEGKLVALPQRDKWLSEAAAHRDFPMLCNGDENKLITVFGLDIPAGAAPGGQPMCDIHVALPLDSVNAAEAASMLEIVAEKSRAWWGHATPDPAVSEISQQTSDPVRKPSVPPRGLPALKLPEDIPSPEIPHCLGWLNYWSAATARAMGFPDFAQDEQLFSWAQRTASGGWVVRLTQEPLDLDNPEHLDTLLRTYERFPQIGGRSI